MCTATFDVHVLQHRRPTTQHPQSQSACWCLLRGLDWVPRTSSTWQRQHRWGNSTDAMHMLTAHNSHNQKTTTTHNNTQQHTTTHNSTQQHTVAQLEGRLRSVHASCHTVDVSASNTHGVSTCPNLRPHSFASHTTHKAALTSLNAAIRPALQRSQRFAWC